MNGQRRLGPSSEHTRSAVLDLIRSSGTISRVELAEMTGLTATSITRIVKSLMEAGRVIETGFGESTGGKRRSLLQLNHASGFAVGVSIDERRLTYVVTDLGGAVVGQLLAPGAGSAGPNEVVKRVASELQDVFLQLGVRKSDVVGVGVAGAGLDVRGAEGLLSLSAEHWEGFDVESALAAEADLTVVRGNDAACAALGQFWVGRIPAGKDFGLLYMSNGFGLGLVSGGAVVRGASSNVGEIGHMVIDINGPTCWCGSRGCLEMLAAPRAMVADAMTDASLVELCELRGGESDLRHDYRNIARAAAHGSAVALKVVERSADFVARAALSVVNLLDLDTLYLAGPAFAEVGTIYVRAIRELVAQVARTRAVHPVVVELAESGVDAAAVGAASLALQHVLTPHARGEAPAKV